MESSAKPINTNFKVGIKVDLTGKNRSRGSPIPVEHEKRKQSGQIHRQILLQKRGKSSFCCLVSVLSLVQETLCVVWTYADHWSL